MRFDGTQVQNEIYVSGESPWPVGADQWEERAREILADSPYGYIAGGAGVEATMRANLEAFERRRLRPRLLCGHTQRELGVKVLGTRSPFPFMLAPIGVLSIAHPEGELAPARAAAAAGVPFVLSTAASHSIEEIAGAMGDAPRWFQLYWVSDREVTESLVRRAEAAGYGAIVVTLDTLVLGWRPRDLRNAYLPFRDGDGIGQFTSDPVFRSRLSVPPEKEPLVAAKTMLAMFPNLALRWEDLEWLRGLTALPLLVKGVLSADDARRALDAGVDGIVVSNHGGRQVDGSVASLDALVEVRTAVGPDVPLLVDGGVRGGADVVKAAALGASAVLVGRPYVYALAVGGEAGVAAFVRQLAAETDVTLALMGAGSIEEVDETWIVESS
jgi:lactate 2-monooxygenase